MTNPRAEVWFGTVQEFQRLCLDAKGNARSESAEDFTHAMLLNANQWGLKTFLNEGQLKWLCDLAGVSVPKKLSGVE